MRSSMIYKWYCHLRSKDYGIFTSLTSAIWNSKYEFKHEENIPKRWNDNRGTLPYSG
jgi:hypothetical protein